MKASEREFASKTRVTTLFNRTLEVASHHLFMLYLLEVTGFPKLTRKELHSDLEVRIIVAILEALNHKLYTPAHPPTYTFMCSALSKNYS
jgi:hypothetical protein